MAFNHHRFVPGMDQPKALIRWHIPMKKGQEERIWLTVLFMIRLVYMLVGIDCGRPCECFVPADHETRSVHFHEESTMSSTA